MIDRSADRWHKCLADKLRGQNEFDHLSDKLLTRRHFFHSNGSIGRNDLERGDRASAANEIETDSYHGNACDTPELSRHILLCSAREEKVWRIDEWGRSPVERSNHLEALEKEGESVGWRVMTKERAKQRGKRRRTGRKGG